MNPVVFISEDVLCPAFYVSVAAVPNNMSLILCPELDFKRRLRDYYCEIHSQTSSLWLHHL